MTRSAREIRHQIVMLSGANKLTSVPRNFKYLGMVVSVHFHARDLVLARIGVKTSVKFISLEQLRD